MNPATARLHEALIRHAKGMISAWELWLKPQQEQPKDDRMDVTTIHDGSAHKFIRPSQQK